MKPIKKILVVDDEPELRMIYEDFLSVNGYDVAQAESGNKAMEILSSRPIDLVVTDLSMPDGNGLKVRDKAIELGIPVIMVTGHSQAYAPLIGGKDILLAKPVMMDVLLRAIDDVQKLPSE